MEESKNIDVFDPRMVVMDSPEDGDGCDHGDFSFAFNNSNFSDRLLHIYISSDPIDSTRSPSEEAGLMEVLKFMYSNNLTVTSAPAVLDVLIAADKFDVASCMRRCSRLLRNLLITTPEFVAVYLDLPSNILMAEELQPLTVVAKQLYAVHYKDITKFEDEILRLPLEDVEALIASDDLRVTSEYAVYLFVVKWARSQYPKIEDRHKIIMTRLAKFIRYPYMTNDELQEVLFGDEIQRFFCLL